MPFTMNPLRRLTAAVLLLCPLSSFADTSIVNWSNDHHQAHFADINGDGVSDLLLQANHVDGSSSLVLGSNTSGDVRYLSSHQQALPAQLSGSHWDASQAKATLADFNGDGFADWPNH